jgi:hypothetical protein
MSSTAAARVQNLVFLGLALAFLGFAMFPGRFDGDAIVSYRQGLAFAFADAASVWVKVLLGVLADIAPGPGPMFLLQLVLWIGGLAAFTDALIATGHRITGQAVALLAVAPLLSFDFFDVQKDALLSGLLIVLIAIGARRLLLRTGFSVLGAAGTLLAFLLALDARHNALFALFPLVFLYWPVRAPKPKALLVRAAGGLCLLAAAHLALDAVNHGPLKAERKHFAFSLMVYDLAGVSARTHEDASRGRLPGFLAQAQRCYSPHEWDAFQGGACQAAGLAARSLMQDPRTRHDLVGVWAGAILRHPIAYASHRASHFGCLLSVGCQRQVQAMSAGWWVRPWDEPNMRVSSSARALGAIAAWMWRGPLGSGALWLLTLVLELAAGAWTLRRGGFRPVPYLAVIVSASGLAYLMSFALVGIADQMRYLHPPIFLGVTALPLALHALIARRVEPEIDAGKAAPAAAPRGRAPLRRRRAEPAL